MKRMHVHVSVANIENAVGFYSALFATKPSVLKHDYAKWMLDDPRVHFAISARGGDPGLDHLGIQVESEGELQDVYSPAPRGRWRRCRGRQNNVLLRKVRKIMD